MADAQVGETFLAGRQCFFLHPEHSWLLGIVEEVKPKDIYVMSIHPEEAARLSIKGDDSIQVKKQNLAPLVSGALEEVRDLLHMPYLHESVLLYHVRERYFRDYIYTNIGPILLALNPFTFDLPHYKDDRMPQYIKEGAVALHGGSSQLPHSWSIAHEAYWLMKTKGENQSILVSGESGAGKTEGVKIVLRYLATCSTFQVRHRKSMASAAKRDNVKMISDRVEATSPILEAFGNACTLLNDNSSRFGKFLAVFFDEMGLFTGAAITPYLLEKSRLVNSSLKERNYHSFYQMIRGSTAEEKAKWKLSENPEDYPMLEGVNSIPGVDDAEEYSIVRDAMTLMGLSEDEQETIYRTCAGMLHLSKVHFVPKGNATDIADRAPLDTAAELWGVHSDTLALCLVQKETSLYTTPVSAPQAVDRRDALIKALYQALFSYIIDRINGILDTSHCDKGRWIGLLDIFGFEHFEKNSFEQLCINLANEQLQSHYNKCVFERDMEEYRKEDLDVDEVKFADNQPVIDLLIGKMGVFDLLDSECVSQHGTDENYINTMDNQLKSHRSKAFGRHRIKKDTFSIKHYAASVDYCVTNFRDKNLDTLPDTLKKVMVASSFNIIKDLLPAPAEENADEPHHKRKLLTVGSTFRNSLKDLMDRIYSTNPHWIRCIKPHPCRKPRNFHGQSVMNQLSCAGVLETVKIRKAGYSVRIPHVDFVSHYKIIWINFVKGSRQVTKTTPIQLCEEILGFADCAGSKEKGKDAQVGKKKVFMRNNVFNKLEHERAKLLTHSAEVVQSCARSLFAQRTTVIMKKNAQEREWFCNYESVHRGAIEKDEYYEAFECQERCPREGITLQEEKEYQPIMAEAKKARDIILQSRAEMERELERQRLKKKREEEEKQRELEAKLAAETAAKEAKLAEEKRATEEAERKRQEEENRRMVEEQRLKLEAMEKEKKRLEEEMARQREEEKKEMERQREEEKQELERKKADEEKKREEERKELEKKRAEEKKALEKRLEEEREEAENVQKELEEKSRREKQSLMEEFEQEQQQQKKKNEEEREAMVAEWNLEKEKSEQEREQLQKELEELRSKYARDMEAAAEEKSALESKHASDIGEVTEAKQALEQERDELKKSLGEAKAAHAQAVADAEKASRDQNTLLSKIKTEMAETVANLQKQLEDAREAAKTREEEYSEEVEGLRKQAEEEREALKSALQAEQESEVDAVRRTMSCDIQALRENMREGRQELEDKHALTIAELSTAHQAEKESLQGEVEEVTKQCQMQAEELEKANQETDKKKKKIQGLNKELQDVKAAFESLQKKQSLESTSLKTALEEEKEMLMRERRTMAARFEEEAEEQARTRERERNKLRKEMESALEEAMKAQEAKMAQMKTTHEREMEAQKGEFEMQVATLEKKLQHSKQEVEDLELMLEKEKNGISKRLQREKDELEEQFETKSKAYRRQVATLTEELEEATQRLQKEKSGNRRVLEQEKIELEDELAAKNRQLTHELRDQAEKAEQSLYKERAEMRRLYEEEKAETDSKHHTVVKGMTEKMQTMQSEYDVERIKLNAQINSLSDQLKKAQEEREHPIENKYSSLGRFGRSRIGSQATSRSASERFVPHIVTVEGYEDSSLRDMIRQEMALQDGDASTDVAGGVHGFTMEEFIAQCEKDGLDSEMAKKMFLALDEDKSGYIDAQEMMALRTPENRLMVGRNDDILQCVPAKFNLSKNWAMDHHLLPESEFAIPLDHAFTFSFTNLRCATYRVKCQKTTIGGTTTIYIRMLAVDKAKRPVLGKWNLSTGKGHSVSEAFQLVDPCHLEVHITHTSPVSQIAYQTSSVNKDASVMVELVSDLDQHVRGELGRTRKREEVEKELLGSFLNIPWPTNAMV